MKPETPALDRDDIQGLLASGHYKFDAHFIALRITDAVAARRWLGEILPRISTGNDRDKCSHMNIAFSHSGLSELGCPRAELDGFSREFREGMATEHRQRVLGDLAKNKSDPKDWKWGGPGNPVHLLLALYEPELDQVRAAAMRVCEALRGVSLVCDLPSVSTVDDREHFGFKDGFGQPVIAGLGQQKTERAPVAPGEFILGHPDNSGEFEPAPAFAHNGSYLVMRQLAQDVPGFWRAFGALSDAEKVALAARMVGRMPDGSPLAVSRCPVRGEPLNDFGYHDHDASGHRCPFGAHIRRLNPRDALVDDPEESMRLVNRHRLLRRGRVFGLPLPAGFYPPGCEVKLPDGAVGSEDEPRGLYFVCLNASIARQFEFVQQTWLNNTKFHGLSNETDPIAAPHSASALGEPPVFVQQGDPVRTRVEWSRRFVFTVGGEYFFMPSLSALRQLARAT